MALRNCPEIVYASVKKPAWKWVNSQLHDLCTYFQIVNIFPIKGVDHLGHKCQFTGFNQECQIRVSGVWREGEE